jgi:hypothetical protein
MKVDCSFARSGNHPERRLPPISQRSIVQLAACLLGLVLLQACATPGPQVTATQEARTYQARAAHDYTPPGPPDDPWGPYIAEASQRFDVPQRWIREVMRVESGGHAFLNGVPITSDAGAMGVMQVMPETYDEMRAQYGLGDDPFDPHNSILAGTAYMREMYEMYGSPGFLAAYNAGPGRLDDYLTHNKPLPDETRRYVAMIGPNIVGAFPANRSPAETYAMNQLPIEIPPGPRFPSRRPARGRGRATVEVAALPTPPAPPPIPVPQLAAFEPPVPPRRGGFHLIPTALADTLPPRHGETAGGWAIQVGAYANEGQARAAAGSARAAAALGSARPAVTSVAQAHGTLYRARVTGLSREAAVQACDRLARGHDRCVVLSPSAQS